MQVNFMRFFGEICRSVQQSPNSAEKLGEPDYRFLKYSWGSPALTSLLTAAPRTAILKESIEKSFP